MFSWKTPPLEPYQNRTLTHWTALGPCTEPVSLRARAVWIRTRKLINKSALFIRVQTLQLLRTDVCCLQLPLLLFTSCWFLLLLMTFVFSRWGFCSRSPLSCPERTACPSWMEPMKVTGPHWSEDNLIQNLMQGDGPGLFWSGPGQPVCSEGLLWLSSFGPVQISRW